MYAENAISPTYTKTQNVYHCWCGSIIKDASYKSKHIKTKKHIRYIQTILPLPKDIANIVLQYIH